MKFSDGVGTLSFSKNNYTFGVAFSDLRGPLFPVVCFNCKDVSISLI